MKPRKHQIDTMAIVDEIIAGADIKDITAMVTPGGGKSALPIIMGKLITKGFADAICWICPRKTLQRQAEGNFQDPFFRKMFGHNLSIRSSTNQEDPRRGLDGFVTTYQAAGLDDKKTILQEIKSRRYIVVLDEYHHAEEDSIWAVALSEICESAKYLLKMTGTMERNSGKKIAFTEYTESPEGMITPSVKTSTGRTVIYSRSDALSEKAIIPLRFKLSDAKVEWEEESGKVKHYRSLKLVNPSDTGKAIHTAINTEYSEKLIDAAIAHWVDHRQKNTNAKMLIVSDSIKNAKKAVAHLERRHYGADIATSQDTDSAAKAIQKFQNNKISILCGVAMFYEGFDCPEVSHIVSLTNIRSAPWIEQMFARSVRVNRSLAYNKQYGYIFAMDDPLIHDIILQIKAEQLPYLKCHADKEQLDIFSSKEPVEHNPYNIKPIGSDITTAQEITLGDHWPGNDDIIEYKKTTPIVTPSDREKSLRHKIESHVRIFCRTYKYKNQAANQDIKNHFNKGRSQMTITELESCLAFVQRTFKMTGSPKYNRREAVRYYG